MYKLLSYKWYKGMVGWPGSMTYHVEPVKMIEKGSASNTFKIEYYNHLGTHFDAPKHFCKDGLAISELPIDRFVFEAPLLIDVPFKNKELIEVGNLEKFESQILECDLLLIRTGYEIFRKKDPEKYQCEGPGISPFLADWLVKKFKNLKAIGFDFISLSSFLFQEEGIKAHRILLGENKANNKYINIIEDMVLERIEKDKLKRVFAFPILIEEIDSAPVTVLAEVW